MTSDADAKVTRALRVFVVAEQEDDAQVVVRELQRRGISVEWTRNVEEGPLREALAIVRDAAGDVPLVVTAASGDEPALAKTASRIAHDLRNVLNPLLLEIQVAQRACARGDLAGAKDVLDEMRALVERGVKRIDTLREAWRGP